MAGSPAGPGAPPPIPGDGRQLGPGLHGLLRHRHEHDRVGGGHLPQLCPVGRVRGRSLRHLHTRHRPLGEEARHRRQVREIILMKVHGVPNKEKKMKNFFFTFAFSRT